MQPNEQCQILDKGIDPKDHLAFEVTELTFKNTFLFSITVLIIFQAFDVAGYL